MVKNQLSQEEKKKQKQLEKEKKNQEEKDKETPQEDSKSFTPEVPGYKPVKYEGKTVVDILQQGHTNTHFHCKMSDGSTMHVPRSEFKYN